MKKSKLCIVGLDGATWKVLDPLIKKSKLPFLKSLVKRSAYGTLLSPTPSLSAPSWVSFYTGVNPGKHSIFDFIEYRDGVGAPKINNSKDVKVPKIWDILGDENIKSLIINMPLSYPLKKMNGVMVSSFLTPKGADYVHPKMYQKQLDAIDYEIDILTGDKFGVFPSKMFTEKDRRAYLYKLIDISKKRVKAYKILSELDDFSFSFLLFKETDLAQHLFWGKEELEIYYMHLDGLLKELYEFVISKGNSSFVLISDHGFHKAPKWEFSVYSWIGKEYKLSKNVGKSSWNLMSSVNKKIKSLGLNLTSMSVFDRIRNQMLTESRQDFAKENGYLVSSHGLYNFGWFNNEDDLGNLSRKLLKIEYRGKKVFKLVKTSKDVYKGQYTLEAPDIIWETNSDFIVDTNVYTSEVYKKRKNTLLGEHGSDNRGIYMAVGDIFDRGRGNEIQMYDMTSMLLKTMGVKLPWYSDGVLPSFFKEVINTKQKKNVERKISDEMKNL